MELWDLYDENRQPLGRTHVRGDMLPFGCYHLAVHVWIRNARGDYLMSRRAMTRPTFAGLWECVGGSVVQGEDSLTGAMREAFEEIGVRLDPAQGHVVFSKTRGIVEGRRYNDIMDAWVFRYDGDADLSLAPTDEVSETKWMTKDEVRMLFDMGEMVPSLSYFFEREDI